MGPKSRKDQLDPLSPVYLSLVDVVGGLPSHLHSYGKKLSLSLSQVLTHHLVV